MHLIQNFITCSSSPGIFNMGITIIRSIMRLSWILSNLMDLLAYIQAIKEMFLYFNLHQSITLDSSSSLVTSISFLANFIKLRHRIQ